MSMTTCVAGFYAGNLGHGCRLSLLLEAAFHRTLTTRAANLREGILVNFIVVFFLIASFNLFLSLRSINFF